jgi:hypothetical protein
MKPEDAFTICPQCGAEFSGTIEQTLDWMKAHEEVCDAPQAE